MDEPIDRDDLLPWQQRVWDEMFERDADGGFLHSTLEFRQPYHERPLDDCYYGTDSTDKFDTLAEATVLDDGTIHVEVVQIDDP